MNILRLARLYRKERLFLQMKSAEASKTTVTISNQSGLNMHPLYSSTPFMSI